MEHRWGKRVDIDVPVQLRSSAAAIGAGNITNASITGAFICTDVTQPFLARIEVWIGEHFVSAFVVRNAPSGLGVEWCHRAPEMIAHLLAAKSTGSPAD